MEEEAAEDLGDRKNPMPVRNGPEHMPAEPLAELHGPFLSAAGAELSLLTTEREEPFCAAGVAANAGKTCAQVATLQVMDHDLLQIGSPSVELCWRCLLRWVGSFSSLTSYSRVPSRSSLYRLMTGLFLEDVSPYFRRDLRTSLPGRYMEWGLPAPCRGRRTYASLARRSWHS